MSTKMFYQVQDLLKQHNIKFKEYLTNTSSCEDNALFIGDTYHITIGQYDQAWLIKKVKKEEDILFQFFPARESAQEVVNDLLEDKQ